MAALVVCNSVFFVCFLGGDWSSPAAAVASLPTSTLTPPTGPPASHRRTPSEADRWLEEVSRSVRAPQSSTPPAQQPFPAAAVPAPMAPAPAAPMAFMPPMPAPAVPVLPPRQPAFHPQPSAPAYPVPLANGLPYGQPSVPVVGITPSQMVANVFGSAAQPPQPAPVPFMPPMPQQCPPVPQFDPHIAFGKPPMPVVGTQASVSLQPPNGNAAFNGTADGWASPAASVGSVPPQPQADAFEAQWAALESRTHQRTTPSPTNPFSSELHKTFEIQL